MEPNEQDVTILKMGLVELWLPQDRESIGIARKLLTMLEQALYPGQEEQGAQKQPEPISHPKYNWTEEEEEILRNNLHKTPAQLREILDSYGFHRSYGGIYYKRNKMREEEQVGEEGPEKEPEDTGPVKGSWSDTEEEYLINNIDTMKLSEIAKALNRGYQSVVYAKDKLIREGRISPDKRRKHATERIDDLQREVGEEDEEEEYGDSSFPETLITYLWNNTDWKRVGSREERIEGIQKIIKDRYGIDVPVEEIESMVSGE